MAFSVSNAFNAVKNSGKKLVDKVVDTGSKVVTEGGERVTEAVADSKDVLELSTEATSALASKGKKVLDQAVRTGTDAARKAPEKIWNARTSFVKKAPSLYKEHAGNYLQGVGEWAKSNWETARDVVKDPRNTLRGIDSAARFNPVYGIPAGILEGKNPAEVLGDNYRLGTGIRDNVVKEYRDIRDEHGYAGVAGYIAPEVALAVATAGSGSAASTTARTVAKETGKELVPGPTDVVTEAAQADQNDRRWWESGPIDLVL